MTIYILAIKIKKIIIIALLPMLLAGCFSTAITGANAVYNRQNIQNVTSQYKMAGHLNTIIKENYPDAVDSSRIRVFYHNYMVLLLGDVPQQTIKQSLENELVEYVKPAPVYSHLEVSQDRKKAQNNPWVNTKIRTQFIKHGQINPRAIKIIVDDNTAYLIGNVTEEQGHIAANIASRTKGVKKVITYFQIIQHDLSLKTRIASDESDGYST